MHRPFRKWIPILTSLAFIVLLVTSITYAQDDNQDPVLQAARDAGLVDEIGKSQTIGAVTVTLDWAYTDAQGLMVGYTIKTSDGTDPSKIISPYSADRLTDDKGAAFSYASGGPVSPVRDSEVSMVIHYYSQVVIPVKGSDNVEVNNDYFNPPPDNLKLKFELKVGGFSPTQMGGGSDSTTKPADYVDEIGIFTFDFSIPFNQAVVLKPAQTIKVKGVKMTLQQVMVTPTKTSVQVCYTMPSAQDWLPDGSVTMGEARGSLSGTAILGSKGDEANGNNAPNRCRNLTFDVFHASTPATLNINIDHLATSMGEGPEDWNAIKAELAKHNIKIEVVSVPHALSVNVISVPKGVDYDQAVIEAREALGTWLNGPWTFKVDLP